eukprot:9483754-Pyramimonas_sp.AAC.1
MYEEAALSTRRARVRGVNALDQVEYVHIVTSDALQITDRERRHYPGTTYGNAIGPVVVNEHKASLEWHLKVSEKKKIYGAGGRIEVGQKTPGISDADIKRWKSRGDEDIEPMCFHAWPKKLLEEYTRSYEIKAWVNLTGCEGSLEEVCVAEKIPVLTVCHTDDHAKALRTRLQNRTFEMFQDSTIQKLYQPGLAKL